jgi:esterase/lipase
MNKILNYMVQLKNPNIYVKSHWVIDETCSSINKIKVKVIVLENNKDYAIKMLIGEMIYNIKKRDKKYSKYLEKVDTTQKKE